MGLNIGIFQPQLEQWLRAASDHPAPAIILGGSANSLSFARSLGRRGIPVLMLNTERYLGTYTRYARFIQLPPVNEQPDEWLKVFAFIGSRLQAPAILFPTMDAHCRFVTRHCQLLRAQFRFLVAKAETVEAILNKRLQYAYAQSIGVRIPRTYFPQSVEEAREYAPQLQYPCLLKPYETNEGSEFLGKNKLLEVSSPAELLATYQRISSSGARFMLQEIVAGEDSDIYAYTSFWNAEAQETAWVTMRKLRQYPHPYGNGAFLITLDAPEIAELSRQLLRGLNYSGYVGIEFKRDPRDKTYYLIEVNPRTESFNQLAVDSGVDLPWIGYCFLTQPEPVQLSMRFQTGVKFMNEELDLLSFAVLHKLGKLGLFDWLQSLRGARTAIAAWDDPAPLLNGMWRFIIILWHTAIANTAHLLGLQTNGKTVNT